MNEDDETRDLYVERRVAQLRHGARSRQALEARSRFEYAGAFLCLPDIGHRRRWLDLEAKILAGRGVDG